MSRWAMVRGACIVVAVALLAMLIWQGLLLRHNHMLDDRGVAAIRIAEDQVLDLTTLDSGSVREKIGAIQARTTGDFTRQLKGITRSFVDAVRVAKLHASGDIDAAAIVKCDARAATVIVATSVLVSSKNQRQPASRSYRMKVELVWSNDAWLIDGMEFVA